MQKLIEVEGIGEVVLARRKGTRHIRLSINGGKVRLSVPYGVNEQTALRFLQSKQQWLKKHIDEEVLLKSGDRIGRVHTMFFEPYETNKISARLNGQTIVVRYPRVRKSYEDYIQTAAVRGAKKALLKEAEQLLPRRLEVISQQIDISYRKINTKFMKSRWGHCSNLKDITLNAYLVQYDWRLIDYVIIHELAHTIHHNHSDRFWNLVAQHCPNHKHLRKQLKSQTTAVNPNSLSSAS